MDDTELSALVTHDRHLRVNTPTQPLSSDPFEEYDAMNSELAVYLDPKAPEEFFHRLNQKDCREHIIRRIKHWTGCKLDEFSLLEAYQDTLVYVYRLFLTNKIDPIAPLRSVFWVASCRGRDVLRRRNREAKADQMAAELNRVRHEQNVEASAEVPDLKAIMEHILRYLPAKQREVFAIYCENFHNLSQRSLFVDMAKLVAAKTKRPEKPERIRSALRNALRKAQEELQRLGLAINKEAELAATSVDAQQRHAGLRGSHLKISPQRPVLRPQF